MNPPVYYACSYIPPEIIWAAGYQPVRLLPGKPAPGTVDAYLPRDFCPYVRAAFAQLFLSGRSGPGEASSGEARAVILTACCDPLRRLADLLSEMKPSLPVFLLEVPRNRGKEGERRFTAALRELGDWLAHLSGQPPSLPAACRLFGELRTLLRQRERGGEFHRLVRWALTQNPTLVCRLLGEGILPPEIGTTPQAAPWEPGIPLLVITSHPVDPLLWERIEENGGRVVAEDSCLGERLLEIPSCPGEWEELAACYLRRPPCPRMEQPQERMAYLRKLARARGGQAAVFLYLKYCDNLGYDFVWVKNELMKEEPPLPVLFLETDFGAAASGQTLTRWQAFLETLEGRTT